MDKWFAHLGVGDDGLFLGTNVIPAYTSEGFEKGRWGHEDSKAVPDLGEDKAMKDRDLTFNRKIANGLNGDLFADIGQEDVESLLTVALVVTHMEA